MTYTEPSVCWLPFLSEFDEIFMPSLSSLQALLISCVNAAIFSLDKWNVDCCWINWMKDWDRSRAASGFAAVAGWGVTPAEVASHGLQGPPRASSSWGLSLGLKARWAPGPQEPLILHQLERQKKRMEDRGQKISTLTWKQMKSERHYIPLEKFYINKSSLFFHKDGKRSSVYQAW